MASDYLLRMHVKVGNGPIVEPEGTNRVQLLIYLRSRATLQSFFMSADRSGGVNATRQVD